MDLRRPLSILIVAILAASATQAQTPQLLPLHRTADLLLGDSQTVNPGILRAHDGNLDGDYNDVGELTSFFDPLTAIDPSTGLTWGATIFGNTSALTIDRRGRIYAIANTSSNLRTMMRFHDLNADGDANDAGEANVFFDFTNAGGLAGYSLQGIVFDDQDRVWIAASGQGGSSGVDRVFVGTDVNLDGDINDGGEVLSIYNRTASIANGNPSLDNPGWAGFLRDGNYYMTNFNTNNQGVWKLAEAGVPNGSLDDAGEVTPVYTAQNGNPVTKFTICARFDVNNTLYLYNLTDKKLLRAVDGDNNGRFDDAGEGGTFFTSGDNGLTIGAGFGFDLRDDGALAFGDTGASPNNRVILLKDLNLDGDASDAGEQTVVLNLPASAFPAAKPKSLLFLPSEPVPFGTGTPASSSIVPILTWDRELGGLPYPGNSGFTLRLTSAPAGVGALVIYSEVNAPIQLDTLLAGLTDPMCTLYPSLIDVSTGFLDAAGLTDSLGELSIPSGLVPYPPLAGKVFYAQILTVDSLLATPIIATNALQVPIL